ncbi:MAG: uroporphyrinogen-III C-methyltransferase [Candidatus Sumerlaeia bacterium]|nr:uroporphyrinogen-III C-methyltransferase [Candidatus Sumerlaeia bacterium]
MEPGEVWLVGAGPGDPGLLTTAGFHLLTNADVVVHDRLGCEEILELISPQIKRVDVGKLPGGSRDAQEEIHRLLLHEARNGRKVVRLKGGDPFVFGRGMEEIQFLQTHGITAHVVPGVTSAFAGPASAGIPVTHRTLAQGVQMWTGHTREGAVGDLQSPPKTRIFLMAMGSLGRIVEELLEEGLSPTTPCAIVSHATTYRQRSIVSTLNGVVESVRENGITNPAIFLVGDVASFAQEKEPAPVYVVTGTRLPPLAGIALPGAKFLSRPLVEMAALSGECRDASMARLADILSRDWLIFNNPWAVRHFMGLLLMSGRDSRAIRPRLAVVGEETAFALQKFSLMADQVIVEGNREEICRKLAGMIASGSAAMATALGYNGGVGSSLGGHIDLELFPVYQVVERKPGNVDWSYCRGIVFSSPRAVDRFARAWPSAPVGNLEAVCIGDSTVRAAGEHGFMITRNLTESLPQETGRMEVSATQDIAS